MAWPSIVGLALAYKWELLGGSVAAISMAALFVLRPDLLHSSFPGLAIPALLYVVTGSLQLRKRKVA